MQHSLRWLLDNRRWVFWLNRSRPGDGEGGYLVCVVFENEPGFFPTGGGDVEPWYWDEETCRQQNQERGFSPEEAFLIVASSMGAGRVSEVV